MCMENLISASQGQIVNKHNVNSFVVLTVFFKIKIQSWIANVTLHSVCTFINEQNNYLEMKDIFLLIHHSRVLEM